LLITTGEPAGIGPELAAVTATGQPDLVVVADPDLLERTTRRLDRAISLRAWQPGQPLEPAGPATLNYLPVRLRAASVAGTLNPANAEYVLDTLRQAVGLVMAGQASALVTGPVHKGVINDAGHAFSGHTGFLAALAGAERVVMMLVAGELRVALATTHLPLRAVAEAIDRTGLRETLEILARDLVERFDIADPRIAVLGLNPHAGEGGHLGGEEMLRAVAEAIDRTGLRETLEILARDLVERFDIAEPRIAVLGLNPHAGEGGHLGGEEIDVIEPVIAAMRARGLRLDGPLPADTAFLPRHLQRFDAVLAMYHDQGLPVLKHAGFGHAVNVTLGLPFIRTSVDHGTALDLAGTGHAEAGSMQAAIELARRMAGKSFQTQIQKQ